jgi:hypothetical protein
MWKAASVGYYETQSRHSMQELLKLRKRLSSQWISALWFEDQTQEHASMKQE